MPMFHHSTIHPPARPCRTRRYSALHLLNLRSPASRYRNHDSPALPLLSLHLRLLRFPARRCRSLHFPALRRRLSPGRQGLRHRMDQTRHR